MMDTLRPGTDPAAPVRELRIQHPSREDDSGAVQDAASTL